MPRVAGPEISAPLLGKTGDEFAKILQLDHSLEANPAPVRTTQSPAGSVNGEDVEGSPKMCERPVGAIPGQCCGSPHSGVFCLLNTFVTLGGVAALVWASFLLRGEAGTAALLTVAGAGVALIAASTLAWFTAHLADCKPLLMSLVAFDALLIAATASSFILLATHPQTLQTLVDHIERTSPGVVPGFARDVKRSRPALLVASGILTTLQLVRSKLNWGLQRYATAHGGTTPIRSQLSQVVFSGLGAASPHGAKIENRAVSAAFLRYFTAQCVDCSMRRQAKQEQCSYLRERIETLEAEIECEQAAARAKPEAELVSELFAKFADSDGLWQRESFRQYCDHCGFKPHTDCCLSWEEWCIRLGSTATDGIQLSHFQGLFDKEYMARHNWSPADPVERWVGKSCTITLPQLQQELQDRQQSRRAAGGRRRTTARDVHKLVIKPATDALCCRYVELSGVGDGVDVVSGLPFVGPADFFFSYSWDSSWQAVVDALSQHSEQEEAAGRPPPFYWIDLFAVNQHWPAKDTATGICTCPSNCRGCAAMAEDLPDWQTIQVSHDRGFDRVIGFCRRTLALMEPWSNPRPISRVWCLFEDYTTLQQPGGTVNVVLPRQERRELQHALQHEFAAIDLMIGQVDARRAEATVETDRLNILGAIERLPGGFDAFNEELRQSLRRLMAESATELLRRAESANAPQLLSRQDLANEAEDYGSCDARLTQFIDVWPRATYTLMTLFIVISIGLMGGVGTWTTVLLDRRDEDLAKTPMLLGGILFAVMLVTFGAVLKLEAHTKLRLLPHSTGFSIFNCLDEDFITGLIVFVMWAAMWAMPALLGFAAGITSGGGLLFFYVFVCFQASSAVDADAALAALKIRVAWQWQALGETARALELLREAHQTLLKLHGRNCCYAFEAAAPLVFCLHAAAAHARTGDPMGKPTTELEAEAAAVTTSVLAAATRNAVCWRRWVRCILYKTGHCNLWPEANAKIGPSDWLALTARVQAAAGQWADGEVLATLTKATQLGYIEWSGCDQYSAHYKEVADYCRRIAVDPGFDEEIAAATAQAHRNRQYYKWLGRLRVLVGVVVAIVVVGTGVLFDSSNS